LLNSKNAFRGSNVIRALVQFDKKYTQQQVIDAIRTVTVENELPFRTRGEDVTKGEVELFTANNIDLIHVKISDEAEARNFVKYYQCENEPRVITHLFMFEIENNATLAGSIFQHGYYDARSLYQFVEKINNNLENNDKPALGNPEVHTSGSDSHRGQSYLNSNAFEKDKKYWNDTLSTVSLFGAQAMSESERCMYPLKQATFQKLDQFCKDHKLTIVEVITLAAMLAKNLLGFEDAAALGFVADTNRRATRAQIGGMNVNNLLLKVDNIWDYSIYDALKKVKAEIFDLLKHRRFPLFQTPGFGIDLLLSYLAASKRVSKMVDWIEPSEIAIPVVLPSAVRALAVKETVSFISPKVAEISVAPLG
jgi:hypothetical protein